MKISVSQIKRHRSCPMLSHYEYDMLRMPAGQVAVALGVGTVTHAAFESLLQGGDWRVAAEISLEELHTDLPRDIKLEEIRSQWDSISICIERGWKTPDDWEIISVEQEMEVPCGNHLLVGRLDGVVGWNGKIWHHQIKTVPSNKPCAIYAEQQRTDWHEGVYQRMAEARYDDVAGTILTLVRKLTLTAATKAPHTAFQTFYLPRSKEEVDEMFADIEQEVNDIEAEMEGERRIIKNRSFCAGQYGNSLCAYKEVCDGVISIDDPERFITVEPRYTQDSETL